MVSSGVSHPPWYTRRSLVKAKYLTDIAKEYGLTTCSINWPITAGADIDLNLPMILPFNYAGDPLPYYKKHATASLVDRYLWKYAWLLPNLRVSLDLFTMMTALDILRDEGQPDVMLVKLCDLDSARHDQGVDSDAAHHTLAWHDKQFGVLLESIRRYGDMDRTHIVILGDHGQTDVERVFNFNRVLQDEGLQKLDAGGQLADYDAYASSAGLSCWIQLKDPGNPTTCRKVYDLLLRHASDPDSVIDDVFTRTQAAEQLGLTGPFDFIIESRQPVSFSHIPSDDLFVKTKPGDYKTAMATHGGLPWRSHQTAFIAYGPHVQSGVTIECARLIDEAPTMAYLLGFDMPGTDGRIIGEIIR